MQYSGGDELVCPGVALDWPAGQAMHDLMPPPVASSAVTPVTGEPEIVAAMYLPAAQSMQAERPALLYLPATHGAQHALSLAALVSADVW